MTTMERQRDDTRTTTADRADHGSRNRVLVVLGLVLALVVGGLVGYLIRGDDNDDVGTMVPAGDTELTARHDEIAELMDDYEQAWLDGDGEAAEAMFAPGGTLRALGATYHADDGEIADYVGSHRWVDLEVQEPMLVDGDMGLGFHDYDELRANTFTFTADGEVLIESHEIGG